VSKKKYSLKDLLLIHELTFIALIILAGASGAFGIHLWGKSSEEASRISSLVTEVQQTRGDLYRQMKELFDAYFLEDLAAKAEYDNFTISIEKHFTQLNELAIGLDEKAAIDDLHNNYKQFVAETSSLFNQSQSGDTVKQTLNAGLETGLFKRYEDILGRTENILNQKQVELDNKLKETKLTSTILLIIPLILAILLLIFSRVFLKRAIVKPLNEVLKATSEFSAGNLTYRATNEGVAELAAVSDALNDMADKLAISQEALVRTEKQAAQGLLVPMLAHNIRNPLASIRAIAQVMDDPEHDADTRLSLRGIIDTVDKLERWTGALLAYLLPLKPQPSSANIKDIVEGALTPLQQRITEKSIQVKLPNWPRNIAVFTDQHLLEQVIYNLALNAIDASTNGANIEFSLSMATTNFVLQILDSGCGMPFTPDPSAMSAPTTKRFGTGIGIPFAFKVCDALGGELKYEARPEGGTAITITLPTTLSAPTN
jgi:signal transduction histidine kinase